MVELVKKRLETIGYVVTEFDETVISYISDTVTSEFLIDTNLTELPEEVKPVLADQTCGKFLQLKRSSNQLNIDTLDFSAISSVSMGDTSVNFGGMSDDASRFDAFVNSLLSAGKGVNACYRKIKF